MRKNIVVRRVAKKGRGVFAARNFKVGDVIENCPVLTFNTKERKQLEKTSLNYYIPLEKHARGIPDFGIRFNLQSLLSSERRLETKFQNSFHGL